VAQTISSKLEFKRECKETCLTGWTGGTVPERDYSERDVLDKLGIKPGQAVAFAQGAGQIESGLRQRILARTERPPAGPEEAVDVVLALVDERTDITAVLRRWKARLKPNGSIWLLSARRGHPGYINQQALIAAGQEAGVVDNKVCSLSTQFSAMRFVIRKAERG
jgi:hypothetical protein